SVVPGVRFPVSEALRHIFCARLAQSVERETLKDLPVPKHLKAVGSTPTSGSIPDGAYLF
ncbi:hypothetical protein MCOR31_006696, partial [Pyricularia oryzae]